MKANTKSQPRTVREFAAAIEDALFASSEQGEFVFDAGDTFQVDRIDSFRDKGMLTNDEGLVVRLDDGSVFHLTIRRA